MYWIINDNIKFSPGNKKLLSIANPEISVVLTSPASRCLLLLLEASPNVVTQQEFFKKVWEDEGMLVPANTLYQNISIVRRGLRTAGETDRILVETVPRKGFQIASTVNVTRIDTDKFSEPEVDTLRGEDEMDTDAHTEIASEFIPPDAHPPVLRDPHKITANKPTPYFGRF